MSGAQAKRCLAPAPLHDAAQDQEGIRAVTVIQANIVIGLLALNAVILGAASLALWDALHTLILQGSQRREWNREKMGK